MGQVSFDPHLTLHLAVGQGVCSLVFCLAGQRCFCFHNGDSPDLAWNPWEPPPSHTFLVSNTGHLPRLEMIPPPLQLLCLRDIEFCLAVFCLYPLILITAVEQTEKLQMNIIFSKKENASGLGTGVWISAENDANGESHEKFCRNLNMLKIY